MFCCFIQLRESIGLYLSYTLDIIIDINGEMIGMFIISFRAISSCWDLSWPENIYSLYKIVIAQFRKTCAVHTVGPVLDKS